MTMHKLIRISVIFNCYESRLGLVNYLAYSCCAYEWQRHDIEDSHKSPTRFLVHLGPSSSLQLSLDSRGCPPLYLFTQTNPYSVTAITLDHCNSCNSVGSKQLTQLNTTLPRSHICQSVPTSKDVFVLIKDWYFLGSRKWQLFCHLQYE